MKQGTEDTKLVKEPENKTDKYIFQKNRKTKNGFIIIVVFLILLIGGIFLSGTFFNQ